MLTWCWESAGNHTVGGTECTDPTVDAAARDTLPGAAPDPGFTEEAADELRRKYNSLTHNSRKYNSNWPTMRRKYYLKSPTMRRKSNWNWLTIRNNLSYNWCLLIWKKVYVFPWRLLLLSGMHSTYKKEINKLNDEILNSSLSVFFDNEIFIIWWKL